VGGGLSIRAIERKDRSVKPLRDLASLCAMFDVVRYTYVMSLYHLDMSRTQTQTQAQTQDSNSDSDSDSDSDKYIDADTDTDTSTYIDTDNTS